VKNAAFISDESNGGFTMQHLITGLIISLFSMTALAGAAPVKVPEPGMLGLFAVSIAALVVARKFRK
jgi:hypothetical protein